MLANFYKYFSCFLAFELDTLQIVQSLQIRSCFSLTLTLSALIGCPKYEVIDIWKKSLNSPKVYIEEPNIFFHFIFHQTKQLITLYVYNLFLTWRRNWVTFVFFWSCKFCEPLKYSLVSLLFINFLNQISLQNNIIHNLSGSMFPDVQRVSKIKKWSKFRQMSDKINIIHDSLKV